MASPTFLQSSLYVAAGGGLGAWLRFLAGRASLALFGPVAFPVATLFVNVAGSLAMGLLAGWLARSGSHGEGTRLLLGVGVLGGFTTFSSFSLEAVLLIERGALGLAALYVALSLAAGVGGLFLGLALTRGLA